MVWMKRNVLDPNMKGNFRSVLNCFGAAVFEFIQGKVLVIEIKALKVNKAQKKVYLLVQSLHSYKRVYRPVTADFGW